MVNIRRKMWTIPDRLFDNLEHCPPALQAEVLAVVRAYNHHWDDCRTAEGFELGGVSMAAQREFFRVYDELTEANRRYFAKCEALAQNAAAGVKKKQAKSDRRKKAQEYYANHREAINSKRRDKYSSAKKSQTKKKICQTKATDESAQTKAGQAIAENSANARKIIGLNNNPSLRSELLMERGFGGKLSYPQTTVNKPAGSLIPTSGLSGSKAVQPPRCDGGCSKPEGGGRLRGIAEQKQFGSGVEGSKDKGSKSDKAVMRAAAMPSLAASSARKVCAAAGTAENRTPTLLSAPHQPSASEVLITKGFKLDMQDPLFAPYYRADVFLRRGVEEWLIRNKLGCSVEKKWICRQIFNFARRQGKENVLMGVENDER